jgi:N-methylhydantoinase B/oxoprolinase/acetone carboxylase alpha subunit
MRSTLVVDAEGDNPAEFPVVAGKPVAGQAVVSHRCGGGGGFGPASERPREAVLADVQDGYVTAQAAIDEYGLDPALLAGLAGASK